MCVLVRVLMRMCADAGVCAHVCVLLCTCMCAAVCVLLCTCMCAAVCVLLCMCCCAQSGCFCGLCVCVCGATRDLLSCLQWGGFWNIGDGQK